MLAAGMMTDQGLPRAAFVGYATQSLPAGGPPEFTYATLNLAGVSGLAAGDYCLVFVQGSGASAYGYISGSGWTQDNYTWTPAYAYRSSVFHKQLTAYDIAHPPVLTYVGNALVAIVAYRGASTASRKVISYDDDGDGSQTVPGFTRAWDCVGVVCALFDRDTDANDYTVGSGWTERLTVNGSPYFRADVADALGQSDYSDGASLTWGNLGTSGPYAQVAQMYELRF